MPHRPAHRWVVLGLWVASAAHSDLLRLENTVLQPQFTVYSSEDGLPSNQVRSLHQDGSGLLWIGTYGGLASFDGSRFETWRAPDDPRPLVVEFIVEDASGALWITAEKRGLYRLDASRKNWTNYSTRAVAERQLRSDDIWTLAPDAQGGLWLGGYGGGLHYIDAQGLVHADDQPSVPRVASDQIGALLHNEAGLWIGTGDAGLWFKPAGSTQVQRCETDSSSAVSSLRGDAQRAYATLIDGRVLRLGANCAELQLIYQAGSTAQIAQAVLLEAGGITAMGLRSGLAWSEPGRESLAWLKPRPGTSGTLPPGIGQALLKDREGGYWIGVHGGGLAYLPAGADQILFVPHDGGSFGALRGRSIRGLSLTPDGAMWVGSTDFGLERVDPQRSRVDMWNPPVESATSRLSVHALAYWKERLWIAQRQALWSAPPDGDSLGAHRDHGLALVHLLLPDGDELWAAARADALYRLDAQGKVIGRFVPGQLAGQEVNQLLLDPEGEVWVASDGGLQRYDRARGQWDFDSRMAQGDTASFCFQNESLWRYSNAGLEHFDRHTRQLLRRFELAEGIPALDTAMLECRGQTLWLLTRNGILAWSPEQAALVAQWRRADGVPGVELGRSTFGLQHQGRYWTGGEGGLLGLDLQLPVTHKPGFDLHLHTLRTQRGDDWLDLHGPHLLLQPHDRNLHLVARATVFRSPASTEYQFQLDSSDAAPLSFSNTSGELDIARLAAGRYTLRVSALHPTLGAASTQPTLDIEVLPEWYQTYWARSTGVLLLALIGWSLFERQRSRLKARHAQQLDRQRREFAEQLAEEKSRFLAQSSHEMKNLLGGATGMAELIVEQAAQPSVRDKAGRLVDLCADLSRLLDDLLDNARLERGQISLARVRFDPLEVCDSVLDALHPRAAQKGLDLKRQFPQGTRTRFGDPLRLRQIVANLLSNAIKYTERGEVRLTAELDDPELLRIGVRDTGPGITLDAQTHLFAPFALGRNRRDSTGLGLWICRQLCDLCGGRITVQSDQRGTAFEVELPWPADNRSGAPSVAPPARLLIVAPAGVRQLWMQEAARQGLPVHGAETLLGVLSDPSLQSHSYSTQNSDDSAPERVEVRVLLPGAGPEELEFALSVLAARGIPNLPEAPDPSEPERYLARFSAANCT